jgi:hypothetical protein
VDPKGLIKSEEEVQQAQAQAAQAAQQAQMQESTIKSGAAAQLAKGYVDNANSEGGPGMSMPEGMGAPPGS